MIQKETEEKKDAPIFIELSVPERVVFSTILPVQGSRAEMALGRSLIERVKITPEEQQEYEMRTLPDNRFEYNSLKGRPKRFRFEKHEILYIIQGVQFHETNKTLHPFNYEIAGRFLDMKIE